MAAKTTDTSAGDARKRVGPSRKISVRLFSTGERKSTVDMVIDKFKELFRNGELHPGDRLPSEADLAVSFQASRSSVREAIKMLAGFGILEVKHGDGTYVSESMSNSLFDHLIFQILASSFDRKCLVELREILENGVVQQAIKNATDEDLEKLEAVHHEITRMFTLPKFDPQKSTEAESRFHRALSAATRNPLLEKLYNFTFELFLPSILRSHEAIAIMTTHEQLEAVAKRESVISVHGGILESLRSRNPKAAKRAVRYSLDTWKKYMD